MFIDPNYKRDVPLLVSNKEIVCRAYLDCGMTIDGYQLSTHEYIKDCVNEVEFEIWWRDSTIRKLLSKNYECYKE